MKGARKQAAAGYRYHVFAYFPCNGAGVRVAIRKTVRGAECFMRSFSKKNNVVCSWRIR